MAMNFRLWLEQDLRERRLRDDLLERLGFKRGAVGALDNKLDEKKLDDYDMALNSMELDSDTVTELMNFVKNNYSGSTIGDLLQQLDKLDVPEKEEPAAPSRPAEIPPGQFIPKPQPQQQMPPEMMQQMPPMG